MLAWLVCVCVAAGLAKSTIDPTVEKLFALHNQVRVDHKKPLIGLSHKLCKVAQDYAALLQTRNTLSHNADGKVQDRLREAGYEFVDCGENLQRAPFYFTEEDVMRHWMYSDSHRKHILGGYQEMGIGFVGFTWVTVFANPK